MRKLSALVALIALLASPASGFDTYWHSQCSQKVGQQFGFTEDAWKIMQLGNFSPDLFGPVSEYASRNMKSREIDALHQYGANNAQSRNAAIFLHFDNLSSDFHSNSNFDYLFNQLLANTQKLLAGYSKLQGDDRVRKVLILVTLGASLHAVQDFYSHTDWIHNDFNQTDVKMITLPSGGLRAPTWFEFRTRHADPDKWPFQVKSGLYPPVANALNTHTHMNHDNSRLMYTEYENPGQPLRLQAEYHNAGLAPARGDDASDLAHQQLAVNTALAASTEWVQKVEENPDAKKAIEFARSWNLKKKDPRLVKELEAGMITETAVSCAAGKWDGDDPPGDRGSLCRSVLARRMNSLDTTSTAAISGQLIGLAVSMLMPVALKFTGMFWDVHSQYHILENLADGIGSNSGRYSFAKTTSSLPAPALRRPSNRQPIPARYRSARFAVHKPDALENAAHTP